MKHFSRTISAGDRLKFVSAVTPGQLYMLFQVILTFFPAEAGEVK